MTCPLCESQVTRYFYYSLKQAKEEGQFQFRISSNHLFLDFHVVCKGRERPRMKNYDTIQLGRVEHLDQLVNLIQYFPLHLEKLDLGPCVSFNPQTKTAIFSPDSGGLILKHDEKGGRIIFLDRDDKEYFSLPSNVVQYNLVNTIIDLQHGFLRTRASSRYESTTSEYKAKMKELLDSTSLSFSTASSEDVPREKGIYVIYDFRVKRTIYVGRTRNLSRRILGNHRRGNIRGSQFRKALGNHFGLKPEAEITEYILKNCSFRFMVVSSPEERIRLEHFSTAVLAPLLNVRLKQ